MVLGSTLGVLILYGVDNSLVSLILYGVGSTLGVLIPYGVGVLWECSTLWCGSTSGVQYFMVCRSACAL